MDLAEFNMDNRRNIFLESKIPRSTKTEPCVLGVDEAGRGPVLGPMVYGIAYCSLSCEEELDKLGFADSKTLTEKKREELFDVLHNNDSMGWMIEIHSPVTICNNMLRRCKYSLNEISQDSAAKLIQRAIALGVNVKQIYVDTVGVAEKYQAKLQNIFPDIAVTVAKQADATYSIVSAASICAKVARDRVLQSWNFIEGIPPPENGYGSGYPNDPITKQYMSENVDPVFGYPQLVRFSWSTASTILENKAAKVKWDEEEVPDVTTEGVPSIQQFFTRFAKSPQKIKKPKYHHFFTDRCLHQATAI